MNFFRKYSIKTRLFLSFLFSVAAPVAAFLYFHFTQTPLEHIHLIIIPVSSLVLCVVIALINSSSITSPLAYIIHALQSFQTRKSGASIKVTGSDEISQISTELNNLFVELNQEIVSLGKKQYQQEKISEKNEFQISIYENRLKLTRSCLKIAQNLNTSLDFKTNLKTILDETTVLLNIQWASVLLIDHAKAELSVACLRGIERSVIDELTTEEYPSIKLKPSEGLAGLVIKDGLPLIANKGYKDPRFKQFSDLKIPDSRIASLLCAPIKGTDGQILGVINFVNRISPPVFRNEDLPYIEDICILVSLIIERNRLYNNLFKDNITGLMAYNIWHTHLQEEINRSSRYAQTLGVVVFEIDSYKDILSRTDLDLVQKIAAACGKQIAAHLRDIDRGASLRERFYALLPGTDAKGCLFFCGRIKEALENETFTFNNESFNVTISAGIAAFPDNTSDPKQLILSGSKALASAIEQGGNRAVIFKS